MELMMKISILLVVICFSQLCIHAIEPEIEWVMYFDEDSTVSSLVDIKRDIDGNYVAFGMSTYCPAIIKFDENKNIIFRKTINRYCWDIYPRSISIDKSGNYYLLSKLDSQTDTVINNEYSELRHLIYIVKVNPQGEVQWEKVVGSDFIDFVISSIIDSDGNLLFIGYVYFDTYHYIDSTPDVPIRKGLEAMWIMKFDSNGNRLKVAVLGGSRYEGGYKINETSDGNYIVCGYASSKDGDLFRPGVPDILAQDAWILKLDKNLNIIWQKTYGGSDFDKALHVTETKDGGFIFLGTTRSSDGDIDDREFNDSIDDADKEDVWLVKLDYLVNLKWQKTFGGSKREYGGTNYLFSGIIELENGDFVIAATTESNDEDIKNFYGLNDCWLFRVNNNGKLVWQKTIGGSNYEYSGELLQIDKNSYFLLGNSNSNDGFAINRKKTLSSGFIAKIYDVYTSIENSDEVKSIITFNTITNNIILNLNNLKQPTNFEIYNYTGVVCKTGIIKTNEEEINISELPIGVYLIKIDNITNKFIKY